MRKNKNRFFVYILSFFILFFCTVDLFPLTPDRAVHGVLHIESSGFAKREFITLNGQWELYWEKLLSPDDFSDNHFDPDGYINVPGSWNSFINKGEKINPLSFGTYRLRVITGNYSAGRFTISFPELVNPARIWIDGHPVKPASDAYFEKEKQNRTDYFPFTYTFTPQSSQFDIIVQMHNNNHMLGGLRETIYFGLENSIARRHLTRNHTEVFLAGILFVMFLYHIALYFLRRRYLENLFFAFLCFFIFIRTGVAGENLFLTHFPALPLVPQIKMEALSFSLSVSSGFLFITAFFNRHVNPKFVRAGAALLAVFPLTVIFTSPLIYPRLLIPFQLLSTVAGLYCFLIMFRAYKTNKREVLLLLSAWLVIFFCTVNDMLYTNNVTESAGFFVPAGMAFFIFMHTFIISMRFSRAFNKAEELGRKLEENNLQLEAKVAARTSELSEKNRLLEEKQMLEEKDMAMAVKVQSSVMPAVP